MADKIRMDISGIALGGMKTAEKLFDNSATRVARIGTTTLGADGAVVDDGVDFEHGDRVHAIREAAVSDQCPRDPDIG